MGKQALLSYNHKDKESAFRVASRLKDALGQYAVHLWVDAWELPPGSRWQPLILKALKESMAMVVVVGPNGLGNWHEVVIQAAQYKQGGRKIPIIYVLLPGGSEEWCADLGPRTRYSYVGFRDGLDNELEFGRLIWAITGEKPEALSTLERLLVEEKPEAGEAAPSGLVKSGTGDSRKHIFFSYSRSDREITDRIVDELESVGYDVWIDREGIAGGARWSEEIVNKITDSAAFIIALSLNSVTSRNVQKELSLADGKEKHIIPVELDAVEIPPTLEFHLAGLQKIDFSASFEDGMAQLLRALARKR